MRLVRFIGFSVVSMFIGCVLGLACHCGSAPPLPPEPPVVVVGSDAQDGSVANVCTHLVTDLHCAFTIDVCTTGIQALQARGDTPIDVACLGSAGSKGAAAACGGGTCP